MPNRLEIWATIPECGKLNPMHGPSGGATSGDGCAEPLGGGDMYRGKKLFGGIGGVILGILLLQAVATQCDKNSLRSPLIRSMKVGLQVTSVDAGGVIVEILPADLGISKEHQSDDDRVVVAAGTTVVVIDDSELTVNSDAYGTVAPGDRVLIDYDVVYVNDEKRVPTADDPG